VIIRGVAGLLVTARVSQPHRSFLASFGGFVAGMVVAKCRNELSGKGKLIMKTIVSFLLGAVMLFGAATLGLQSATANARDKHDKDYWKHHHHHHRRHKHHYKNHLSY
jgi:hypothetical protein